MRTTLDIDEDVLLAAKELAAKERKTAGKILSDLFRLGLRSRESGVGAKPTHAEVLKNGIPVLPSRGDLVTSDHVQRLREEAGM